MTIRFTCDKCGSVLKIKDELAGTDGKCPKCKTRFVVPQPVAEEPATEVTTPLKPEPATAVPTPMITLEPEPHIKATAKPAAKAAEKPAPKSSKKPVEDDEFDPVSFLMEGPKKKPTLDPEPETASRSPMAGGSPSRNGGAPGGFSLDDDDSSSSGETERPAPTRKWGAKKDSSAAATADRALGGSTNAAKDLLARSMEDSRVRASEMPEEEPRFKFDFAGLFREIGVKGLGSIAGVIVLGLGLYLAMTSMIGDKIKLPPLGYVSGTVTQGGKPVAGVKVVFSPVDRTIPGAKEQKERARESNGITNAEGQFTMYYNAETQGVKIGPCRVYLEAMDPSVVIPSGYGPASEHKVEVTSGNNEPQKIDL